MCSLASCSASAMFTTCASTHVCVHAKTLARVAQVIMYLHAIAHANLAGSSGEHQALNGRLAQDAVPVVGGNYVFQRYGFEFRYLHPGAPAWLSFEYAHKYVRRARSFPVRRIHVHMTLECQRMRQKPRTCHLPADTPALGERHARAGIGMHACLHTQAYGAMYANAHAHAGYASELDGRV